MEHGSGISRRTFLGVLAGTTALAPVVVRAQAPPAGKPADPASTITTPPRDFGPTAPPMTYVDPDVITIDPLFNNYRQGTRRSNASGLGRFGLRGRPGAGRGAIWSGAISRTIASCAGSKMTAA